MHRSAARNEKYMFDALIRDELKDVVGKFLHDLSGLPSQSLRCREKNGVDKFSNRSIAPAFS